MRTKKKTKRIPVRTDTIPYNSGTTASYSDDMQWFLNNNIMNPL